MDHLHIFVLPLSRTRRMRQQTRFWAKQCHGGTESVNQSPVNKTEIKLGAGVEAYVSHDSFYLLSPWKQML